MLFEQGPRALAIHVKSSCFNASHSAKMLICLSAFLSCNAPPKTHETRSITVLMGRPKGMLEPETIQEFSRKTGISVRFIPGSESASRRLEQERTLLVQRSSAVDVFQ